MVPADSIQVSRDWTYSGTHRRRLMEFHLRGCHPLWPTFPGRSVTRSATPCDVPYNTGRETLSVWAVPLSLAATYGIDFSFFSTRYLDVSVPWVAAGTPMYSVCSIRVSRDHRSFVSFPKLFADFHALLRLLTPRHPPYALGSLTIGISNSLRFVARPRKRSGSESQAMLSIRWCLPTIKVPGLHCVSRSSFLGSKLSRCSLQAVSASKLFARSSDQLALPHLRAGGQVSLNAPEN